MKRIAVVGGGISGLSTAFFLRRKLEKAGIPFALSLFEKETRTGGKIWSIGGDGYLCEWGPNGFLDNKPQTLELCRLLSAENKLLRSNDNARKRFIFTGGELHRLPENGPSFLKSKLISWPGKMRLALEPFAPAAPKGVDETLASFGRRRLGEEALRKLIAPMVSGIFAGNPETMSLRSCFPRIAELEDEFGSLIVAMMKLAKNKKKDIAAGKVVSSAAGPGGILTSFRGGIQELTNILTEVLGPEVIQTGDAVTSVTKSSTGYVLRQGGQEQSFDAVVMATPAFETASIMDALTPETAAILRSIPYSSMTVACFGYTKDKIRHDLNGFGYLIPKDEGTSTLGTLWDSSIFENRAPAGHVLLRSMLGGACFPDMINLDDAEVQRRVQADLQRAMGIDVPPDFVRIFRHEKAIPQYTVGHGERLLLLEKELTFHPGLFLTGNSYRGIGINDCVAAAERTAEAVSEFIVG